MTSTRQIGAKKWRQRYFPATFLKNENLAAIQNSKNASHEIVGKWNSPAISLLSLGNIQTQWESNDTIRLDLTDNYIKVAWLVFQTVILGIITWNMTDD